MQEWYSGCLIQHGADMLDAVLPVVRGSNGSVAPVRDSSPSLTSLKHGASMARLSAQEIDVPALLAWRQSMPMDVLTDSYIFSWKLGKLQLHVNIALECPDQTSCSI